MSRGAWQQNVGPRKHSADVGPGDPAHGARVPRCRVCGRPETPRLRLYPGLWGYIRFHVDLTLCAECIQELLPDRMALDPLTLEEVA